MAGLLAATRAERLRSRESALHGPKITGTRAAALEGLRRLDGVHAPRGDASGVVDGDATPIRELPPGEAERRRKSAQR